jgi:hypothetical protein
MEEEWQYGERNVIERRAASLSNDAPDSHRTGVSQFNDLKFALTVGRKGRARANVAFRQVREIRKNLLFSHSPGQIILHVGSEGLSVEIPMGLVELSALRNGHRSNRRD